jgi:hypothetical protein
MTTNLLTNPSVNGDFRTVGAGELNVAADWWPWFVENQLSEGGKPLHRPA